MSRKTIDGHEIQCEADEHVMKAGMLYSGDRFAFRSEDLRGQGLTIYRVIAPNAAECESTGSMVSLDPDTLVVRFQSNTEDRRASKTND